MKPIDPYAPPDEPNTGSEQPQSPEQAFYAGENALHCNRCGARIAESRRFCESCGAAVEDPDDRFVYDAVHAPALKKARYWILGVGGLYAISGLLMGGLMGGSLATLIIVVNLVLALIHVGLFFWARFQPFAAAVAALGLFVTVHLLNAIADPATLLQGLCVKVLFITVLSGAVKAGLDARRLRIGQ
ncbi:MAG: zinc ribbon domain-containing protein [Deltaproteobacteria bacterium]|nr:zinc ribbon domain-containing protein [Deltaproteobacteria bacterium]